MKKDSSNKRTVIYQAKSGALELRADASQDTFWLTQEQVARVFNVQKAAISKHVRNIFDSKELTKKATVSKMETVQIEGNRRIKLLCRHSTARSSIQASRKRLRIFCISW